jgi:hypothetical protein
MVMMLIREFLKGFGNRHERHTHCIRQDKAMRDAMEDHHMDLALAETFPASDPIAKY